MHSQAKVQAAADSLVLAAQMQDLNLESHALGILPNKFHESVLPSIRNLEGNC